MHEALVIAGASVLGALALLLVVVILFVVAYVSISAARELRKAWRGDD